VAREDDVVERILRIKLRTKVSIEKDSDATLQDALDFLSDRYDLAVRVDEKAFAAASATQVVEKRVHVPRLSGLDLSTVLGLVLRQIELDDGLVASFRITNGALE